MRLHVEFLEDRTVPSTTVFTGADANNPHAWNANANWSNGVPTASSDVIIGARALVNLGLNSTINSLTVNGTLNVSGSNLTLNTVGTVSSLGTLILSGAARLSAPGGFNNAGVLTVGASSTLTVGSSLLPRGLLGWWTGDGDASDSAGGHNGTVSGATFTPGIVNQAFSFDGTDDFINVGNFSLPETFTIAGWINLTGTGHQAILAKDSGVDGMPNSYYFAVEPAGSLVASVRNAAGEYTQYRTNVPAVSTGSWHHVAVTYNGGAPAGQRMLFYVDGNSVGNSVIQDAGGDPETDAVDTTIGTLNGSAWPFSGLLDELRVYNRVLTQGDIQADMMARPYAQTQGSAILTNGTLTANGGVNIEGGSLSGPGVIFGSLFNSGQLDGSGTPGTLTVSGDFTQTPSGVLDEEVAGTDSGNGYDQLNASGAASLDGTLNVSLIDGFFPDSTLTYYQILTFAQRTGDFASKNGLAPNFSYFYDSFSLTLQSPENLITPTTLPNWTVNQPGYNQTIMASGGTGSFTFSQSSGTLPPGLTLSSSGVLAGTPTVPGSYTFTVTATDTVGPSGSQTYTETINPAVQITTTTLPDGTTGTTYSQTLSTSGGTGNISFSAASGTLPSGLTLSSKGVLYGTPTAPGSYSFSVSAKDAVGSSGTMTYTVTISNSAATQLVLNASSTATAGMSFNLTITAEDSGGHTAGSFNNTLTLSSSAGADLSPTSVMLTGGTAIVPITLTSAGSQTITATFAGLTPGTTTVTVSPGPLDDFQVSVPGSSTVQAGNGFLVTVQAEDAYGNPITGYSGPASASASISPTSAASNFPTAVAIGPSGQGLFLGNLQKVGSYTISVAAGAAHGSAATPVTVVPGPAVKLGFGVQPVDTPTGLTLPPLTVQVLDLYGNLVTSDNSDIVTVDVASGPGSFKAGSNTVSLVHNGVATFNNLTLLAPGSYLLSAVVPLKYTGPLSAPFHVIPLQVVTDSLAATPTGFSLQFNAPFLVNSVTPVLFGQGLAASAPVPSVTLTQIKDGSGNPVSNSVEGSLILNTATNTITFLATNTAYEVNNGSPLLPDGTYQVALTCSAAHNGFQALNSGGGFLDGLANGMAGSGDYTTTFTVTAAAAGDDVLWVPATADGPGQALNASGNNQLGGGYPIFLNDGTGNVTSVQVTFNYDPTLLTVTGVSGTGFTMLASSTPGHAVLQYSGPALSMGTQTPIGFLSAQVPGGSTANPTLYKAKDLLHLSAASLNGGTIAIATSDALHLVVFVGDGDGNGSYSSNDAVLITRVGLQTDTGFTAYPLVDPVIVADTDGSGFIPPDAPLQVNEAGIGFATANLPNPPIPSGTVFVPIANNIDPTLSLGVRGQGPGVSDGILTATVNIDDADPAGSTGLTRAHLALSYDPRQFSVSAADVHPGSLLSGGNWSVMPIIDPASGQIGIALSSSTPISSISGSGSLVTIDFHPIGTISGPAPFELVASADPNDQYVTTELEDAQGTFTLSPAPTNGFDPDIDSMVVITAPSAATPVSYPGIRDAPIISTAASDVQPADSRYAHHTAIVESVGPSADTATIEGNEREAAAVPTIAAVNVSAASHVVIATRNSLASMSAGASAAGLLSAFAFQIGGASMGIATDGSPCLAGIFIQALARWTNGPAETIIPVTMGDSFKRLLAGQLLPLLPTADDLDNLNGDNVSSDLEWRDAGDLLNCCDPRKTPAHQPLLPFTVTRAVADQATFDQYFSTFDQYFSHLCAADLTAEDE
jgi:hypothetical protein